MSDRLSNAIGTFKKARDKYENHFGKGSLNNVLLLNPLSVSAEDYSDAARILIDAVESNKKLEGFDDDLFDDLIF